MLPLDPLSREIVAECEEAGESEHLARLLQEYLAPEETAGADDPGGFLMPRRFRPELLLLLSVLAALPAAASWEVNGNATLQDFRAFHRRFSSDAYFYPATARRRSASTGFEAYADATYDRDFDGESFNTTAVTGDLHGRLSLHRAGRSAQGAAGGHRSRRLLRQGARRRRQAPLGRDPVRDRQGGLARRPSRSG